MCGIVGAAGKLTGTTDKMVKHLLILDSLRGTDSTGIAAIDKTEDVRVVKTVGHPFNLFEMKTYDTAIARLNRAIIGHNRFATQGQVNKKNAHPYDFETLVGVHNGTLKNKHKLLDQQHFAVDSENLYHHLEQKGLDDLLSVMEGAYSLVWWDKLESTLNFLRNEERPMYLASSANGEILLWASEPWMLDAVIDRENIVFDPIVQTRVDNHYSFNIGEDRILHKPHVKYRPSLIPKPEVKRNFNGGQSGNTGAISLPAGQQQTPVAITSSNVVEIPKNSRVTPLSVKKVDGSINSYSGQKDVMLEVLAFKKDKRGSSYYVCYDGGNRMAQIRLYINRGDTNGKLVGKEILATIGKKTIDPADGIYYKVEFGSVRLAPHHVESKRDAEENAGKYFADAKRRLIPRNEWENKYSACSMCTAPITPEGEYAFTTSGDILCGECVADPVVREYMSIIH